MGTATMGSTGAKDRQRVASKFKIWVEDRWPNPQFFSNRLNVRFKN